MAGVKDSFRRTTISLHAEEYEALRFMAFKRKTSVAGVGRKTYALFLSSRDRF